MTLRPQKAPIKKAKAAAEESEHQSSRATQQIQSEVEERSKKNAGAKKSAQKQHDAQPEVASAPRGIDETKISAEKSRREDAVPVRRRVSNPSSLSISTPALTKILAHRRASKHLVDVKAESHKKMAAAERMLNGPIAVIGKAPEFDVSEVDTADWWSPFPVDGNWYVLERLAPTKGSKVRVYELMPSDGPAPNGGLPSQFKKAADKGGGGTSKKKNEVKRVFTELYNSNSALMELKLLSQTLVCRVVQFGCAVKPRLLRSLVEMRRLLRSCGIALHDLREFSGAVASVARRSLTSLVFPISVSESATRKQRELVSETFGPTGRLVACDAGDMFSPRLSLNSLSWDTPPRPRADEACGALWPISLFGPREEEVFT